MAWVNVNRFDPQHASRAPIEGALTQADRRLMQAVRMLATLRGLKPAEVLATLPAPAMTKCSLTATDAPPAVSSVPRAVANDDTARASASAAITG